MSLELYDLDNNLPEGVTEKDVTPFVKWPGGKRQILSTLTDMLPEVITNYHDPFCGGGALPLHLLAHKRIKGETYMNDIVAPLITAFMSIRDSPGQVIEYLEQDQFEKTEENYYEVRRLFNTQEHYRYPYERTAAFIFLNKMCVNGIWRVNQKGEFNISYRKKPPKNIFTENNLTAVQFVMKNVRLSNQDYLWALKEHVKEGDFVYLDPPYWKTYDQYHPRGFRWFNNIDLVAECYRLHRLKVKWMMSNTNHSDIRALYQDKEFNITPITTRCSANTDGSDRTMEEVIIRNYK